MLTKAAGKLQSNLEFRKMLEKIAEQDEKWGILIIGIDGFKRINNLYSYSFGDKVLENISEQAAAGLPAEALLYKLDGDCFGILEKQADESRLMDYFEQFKRMTESCDIESITISLTVSGGICFYPADGTDGETLYKNARIALVASKESGGCQCSVLSAEILQKIQLSMNMVEALKESVQNGFEGFALHYQPIVFADTGDLYGCEVLLRYQNKRFPNGVTPYEFIPILENYGLIIEVGSWVMEQSMKQLAEWTEIMPNFQMSVNVSSIQFENPQFKFDVIDLLNRYQIKPSLVTLELTESGKITNIEYVAEIFNFFRGQGIKIALDDFGTGYASLEIFRDLSADELKIDRSFLNRISYDVNDQKIISQLVQLCESMNMIVCVEGIETGETEKVVKQLGANLFQGYYYSKPFDADKFYNLYFKGKEKLQSGPFFKAAEKELSLSYSEHRPVKPFTMEELVDHAYAGIFQVALDHNFSFLSCNEGYRRLLGYTASEISEKFQNRALGFVHPDDAEFVNEEIRRQLGQGDTVTVEFRIVRSDGSDIWILGTGNVVKSRNGHSCLVVVIINNDRFKREALRIEQENALNHKMLSRIPTGIKYIHFDKDFTIDFISDGFLSIIGYTRAEIATIFDNKYINMIYEEDREKLLNDVVEQIKLSNMVVLHYRTVCKDGSLIWLETVSCLYPPDPDGIQRCCSSVVNVTDTITEKEKRRSLSLAARYQDAATLWGDILIEYSYETDKIRCSQNFKLIFDRDSKKTLTEEIELIHREDRDFLTKVLDDLYNGIGEGSPSVPLRIRNGQGEYIWCTLVFNQPDKIGDQPVSVIGKLCRMDDTLKQQKEMHKKMQLDALTGLWNKGAMEKKAAEMIAAGTEKKRFTLLMIDIDDFKIINADYGHMTGDEVLQVFAKRLQSLFKAKDLIGRTGGDEFIVFAEFEDEGTFVEARCEKILSILEEPVKIGDRLIKISVSLGAVMTQGNENFYDIYQQASVALYRTKELGKGSYLIL